MGEVCTKLPCKSKCVLNAQASTLNDGGLQGLETPSIKVRQTQTKAAVQVCTPGEVSNHENLRD